MEEFKEELRSLLRKYSDMLVIIDNDDEALSEFIICNLKTLHKYKTISADESRNYYTND